MSIANDIDLRFSAFLSKGKHHNDDVIPVSIKIRADTGCFHKSCCPYALKIIENKVRELKNDEFDYIEHESGPEIIAYMTLAASGILLAKSIIELVTTIVKARFEGQKHGDHHQGDPITLIVRKTDQKNEIVEEKIITFRSDDIISPEIIGKLLNDGCEKLTRKGKKIERK